MMQKFSLINGFLVLASATVVLSLTHPAQAQTVVKVRRGEVRKVVVWQRPYGLLGPAVPVVVEYSNPPEDSIPVESGYGPRSTALPSDRAPARGAIGQAGSDVQLGPAYRFGDDTLPVYAPQASPPIEDRYNQRQLGQPQLGTPAPVVVPEQPAVLVPRPLFGRRLFGLFQRPVVMYPAPYYSRYSYPSYPLPSYSTAYSAPYSAALQTVKASESFSATASGRSEPRMGFVNSRIENVRTPAYRSWSKIDKRPASVTLADDAPAPEGVRRDAAIPQRITTEKRPLPFRAPPVTAPRTLPKLPAVTSPVETEAFPAGNEAKPETEVEGPALEGPAFPSD